MALVWSEARFATGVAQIDAQHRVMFDVANELLDAVRAGRSRSTVDGLLTILGEQAVEHFACEEEVMERRACSSCLVNKLAHRSFQRDFAEIAVHFARDGVTDELADEIQEKVCRWLESHLLAIDLSLRATSPAGD
ncbi:MAG: hemerythrin domain-containing protein [Acidobacteriota bacterium]|jgi:hemerythrin-like metal-binding protein